MVGTILPIGYGERVRNKPPWALINYVLGSVFGGAVLGLALSLAGLAVWASVGSIIAAAGLIAGAVAIFLGVTDASLTSIRLPTTRRQVPSSWYKRFNGGVVGLLYGGGLGMGVFTHVPVTAFYAVLVSAFLNADLVQGTATLALFGLGRATPLLIIGLSVARNGELLDQRIDRLISFEHLVKYVIGLATVSIGSFLAVSHLMLALGS